MRLADTFDAVMLDLDGTLIDTLGDFVAALNAMLEERGLAPVSPSRVAPFIGKGGEHLVRSVLAACGVAPGQVDALLPDALSSYRQHYDEVNGRYSEVFPGVARGLAGLRESGLKLACVTNKPTAASAALLRVKGLAGFFDAIVGGDQFARLKPDPLPLLATCRALGATPGRTLMVGDSANDALAARAAGCRVVLVTYGFNHGRPVRDVDADGYLDSLDQLRADMAQADKAQPVGAALYRHSKSQVS